VVWTAEYVDLAGVLQKTTINNDGSTVITVRQYAGITFDARDTRSESTGCNTAGGAAQRCGFGVNYGKARGDTWATDGQSQDIDFGPPIFSTTCEIAGALEPELYVRDPDARESTVTLTLNVQAIDMEAVVDLSAAGAWPSSKPNGTVYGITTGDYTSRGPWDTSGTHGVRLIKLGGGANPTIAQFRPDSRGLSHGSVITDRTRDSVLVNVDYTRFENGVVGSTYCGSYGGTCASYGEGATDSLGYVFEWDGIRPNNETNSLNVRFARGTFIVNSGPIDGHASAEQNYCFIGGGRSFNFAGSTFRRTTGGVGGNPMRTYLDSTVLRHMQVYSTTETFGFIKGALMPCVYSATPDDPWPDDDTIGDHATSRALYLARPSVNGSHGQWALGPSYFWICRNVFGGPSTHQPIFIGGWHSQNNDAVTNGLTGPWTNDDCYESGYIGGIEDNRLTYNSSASFTINGQDVSYRGNTQLSGAGWSVTPDANPLKTHPDFRGPFHTDARPLHSALAG